MVINPSEIPYLSNISACLFSKVHVLLKDGPIPKIEVFKYTVFQSACVYSSSLMISITWNRSLLLHAQLHKIMNRNRNRSFFVKYV